MAKTLCGAAAIAFFTLFCTALSVQSDAEWKGWLLIFSAVGGALCGVGFICILVKESRSFPTRGDLFVSIRKFHYDHKKEFLSATLAFNNGDSITRTLIDVRFTYRPNAASDALVFKTEHVSFGKLAGALGEVELLPDRWQTIEYRSVDPKADNSWFKDAGPEAGLYIYFTNGSRQQDGAYIVGLEMERSPSGELWHVYRNNSRSFSLDKESFSKQSDALTEKVKSRPLKGWARYFGRNGCLFDYCV